MRQIFLSIILAVNLFAAPDGEKIYRETCATCHGEQGEGNDDEYDEALIGTRSVESLARLIHKTMPEDDESACEDEDAFAVAAFIHDAFYSPEAQNRLNPPRVELLHLTEHQYRHSITDLLNSFRWEPNFTEKIGGLRFRLFNVEKMDNRKKSLLDQSSSNLSLDLAKEKPHEKIQPQKFAALWEGALLPSETGTYQFRLITPNGVRLFLNSDGANKKAFIDGWVSSKNEMRTLTGKIFLLAGHPVPITLDFLTFEEKESSVLLEWKPPQGTWGPIPAEKLSAAAAPALVIIDTPFPPDDASLGYERGATVSKSWQDAVTAGAIATTQAIFDNLEPYAKTKLGDPDRAKKLENFCQQFTERAFGRPLNDDLEEKYISRFFKENSPDEAAKRAILLTLISPRFLYPSLNLDENGQPDQFTVASNIALGLLDSIPPKQLYQAAEKGQLDKPEQILNQSNRLLNDPRCHHKIERFFYHWLGLSERNDLTKDPKLFPNFDEAVHADLRQSLDLFIDDVVWSQNSDYRQLFLSKTLFLSPRLREIYAVGEKIATDNQAISDENRAGLLTHPYLLAALAYGNETSPIHRGVYLSRNVLGRYLKPPPDAIAFQDAHFKPDLTMREKVTELTKKESCMACHEVINPIGFSLENFDAIGRFRTTAQDRPINTSSDYPNENAEIIKINGPQDIARLAIESPTAHRAFINSLFHHLTQQSAPAYGKNTLPDLQHDFVKNNFNIQKLITHIINAITKERS